MNVLYFLFFFSVVAAGSLFRLITIGAPLFFSLYALLEAFLEAGTLLLIGALLYSYTPRWLFKLFISATFLLLVAHLTDFMILRLMDESILYPINYFFGSGVHHLFAACQSLNLNAKMGLLFGGAVLFLPLGGWLLYRCMGVFGKKFQRQVELKVCLVALMSGAGVLYAMDFLGQPALSPLLSQKFQKSLPVGLKFAPSFPQIFSLSNPLPSPREEKEVQKILSETKLSLPYKPNIYLFVVETLRKDFVTFDTAPTLSAFAEENISFPQSFANANSTHLSWFSIFHSTFPFHWTSMKASWKEGSVPLQMLKQLGYTIRVYSSADLELFEMAPLLFGAGRKLISHAEEYSHELLLSPAERDALAFKALEQNAENKSGQLFVIFLDATHSEYSVPKDFSPKFLPIVDQIDYLQLTQETIEPIKNRYRNAIHYLDSLFGHFFQQLKEKELYEEAIIAITGDHGEEFFEEGALFHGTHLNEYQTSVPIFLRLGDKKAEVQLSTHLDIFPSILHHLTGISDFSKLLDGESVLIKNSSPSRLAVLNNGPSTPSEFFIQQGDQRLRLRCPKGKSIYQALDWEVLEGANRELVEEINKRR
ncbi:MAG TPA: sulfatase-like hydrolase/transferase [Chlamydiales bacterium]|jgi:hypothetical protein